jgi:hypothetical protein
MGPEDEKTANVVKRLARDSIALQYSRKHPDAGCTFTIIPDSAFADGSYFLERIFNAKQM